MTIIFEVLTAISLIWFGIFHPAWQTNPVLRHPAGKVTIALLLIAIFLGWHFYEQQEEDKKIELEKWEFAKKTDTREAYCTYLEEYRYGQFANQAELKCHPPTVSNTQPTEPITAPPPAKAPEPPEWQSAGDRYQVKNGLVKDTVNHLMWMRCELGANWDGNTCQAKDRYTYEQVLILLKNFSYEGYTGWRIPTIQELRSLVYCHHGELKFYLGSEDHKCGGGYDEPAIFVDVFGKQYPNFFISSSRIPENGQTWVVSFYNGFDSNLLILNSESYLVRLVRDDK